MALALARHPSLRSLHLFCLGKQEEGEPKRLNGALEAMGSQLRVSYSTC